MIDALTIAEHWKIVEDAFIRPRIFVFNRHVFLTTKKLRGEILERFYGKLNEKLFPSQIYLIQKPKRNFLSRQSNRDKGWN